MTSSREEQKFGAGFQICNRVQLKEWADGPKMLVKATTSVKYDLLGRADLQPDQSLRSSYHYTG